MHVIQKALATVLPGPDDADSPNGSFELILSAPTLDRDGDVLASNEWKTPLPDHIVMDIDHGMSVATTAGSGAPVLDDQGRVVVKGTYASTEVGQTTRTLVNEGHIRTASVSFMTDKSVKDGKPSRELLNGAFVAVPSNRESVILSSKALHVIEADLKAKDDSDFADPGYLDKDGEPAKDGNGVERYPLPDASHVRSAWSYINQEKNAEQYTAAQLAKIKDKIKAAAEKFGVEVDDDKDEEKSVESPEVKNLGYGTSVADILAAAVGIKAGARNSASDSKMIQAIHDASNILGAQCVSEAGPDEEDGSAEGANKSVHAATGTPLMIAPTSVIVGKSLNGSVEDLQSRLQCALDEAAGAGGWDSAYPWIIATYLNPDGEGGSVVYRLGAETLCRAFSDDGSTVCLDSTIQAVTVITSVAAVPDNVDGDTVMLPPAAADASKSVADATISATIVPSEGMSLDQFKAALDAIPGAAEMSITTTETKSSGPEPGSPESPVTDDSVPPDSKAAPSGPADESADTDSDTATADEAEEKEVDAELLRARLYAAEFAAMNLAS